MNSTNQPLSVLHVEDSELDVELALLQLRRSGYAATAVRVESAEAMREALSSTSWDVVLSDCSMPRFGAEDALALLREKGLEIPFIIVSGTIAEETAAAAMRAGAHDFIRKDKLAGLGEAVERELRRQRVREAQKRAEDGVRASEAQYRALFNACPTPLWAYDPETLAIHAVNDAAVTESGYSRQELAAMTMADLSRGGGRVREVNVGTRVVDIGAQRLAISVGTPARELAGLVAPQDVLELASSAGRPSLNPALEGQALDITGPAADSVGDRDGLEVHFDRALDRLWIALQPIVSWRQRAVFGYEALVRSDEPALAGPSDLFAAAERLGRLNDLGRSIRERVARIAPLAPTGCRLFVNIHSHDFGDVDLFSPWAPLSAIAPSVVLEVTQCSSPDWVERLQSRLQKLRRLGFQIAIDDMGSGHTGLSAFSQIEPEIVKLDMSLVRGIDTSSRKRSVVRSMLELAGRDLGMLAICEGVETAAERDTLGSLGADLLQGYLFAKPSREFVTPRF
jgi:EAL domain-containing protein (putative c-di-GMP-specific phosphodiesterase class I)/FixJ family two-component response regulator